MKTLAKISALSLIIIGTFYMPTFSQGIMLRQINELTNSGLTSGINVNFTLANAMQMGAFYTGNMQQCSVSPDQCIDKEYSFMGVFYSFPITRKGKFNLHFQSRIGVSNGKKIIYAPALVGSMTLTPRLALEAGISNRLYSYGAVVSLSYQFGKIINLKDVKRATVSRYY
jgi:hypothetical protein